jgi:hypothetical protein
MLLIEIVAKSSREFFEGIPEEHQRALVEYVEALPPLTAEFPVYVRTNCPELCRSNFIMNGFEPFNPQEVVSSFYGYCLERQGECRRLMETGFLEDMREFVVQFLESV